MAYNCPLCGSSLTEHHYHKVIKDQEKKEKVQKGALKKFKKEAAVAKAAARIARKQEQETRAKTEQKVAAARKQGTLAERSKRAIRDKRMMARYKKMQEEMQMLKNHTSPQEIGLADEGVLVKRLEMEFLTTASSTSGKAATFFIMSSLTTTRKVASSMSASTRMASHPPM